MNVMESNVRYYVISIVFLLVSPLFARGAIEVEREYRLQLKSAFTRIVHEVESGAKSPIQGKAEIHIVRKRFDRHYSDEFGIMESLIDQVSEGNLSGEDAEFQFALLQKGSLMEYRRSGNSEQSGGSSSRDEAVPGQQSGGSGSDHEGQGEGKREATRNRH